MSNGTNAPGRARFLGSSKIGEPQQLHGDPHEPIRTTGTITTAAVLAGEFPAESSGMFWPQAELLLCRTHLAGHGLDQVADEPAFVLFGFVFCDACVGAA